MAVERLNKPNSNIIRGPEDLPHDITFDSLVEKVGGKAAGLLWIQKHLPHIPQAKMIVAPPGTSTKEIIAEAKAQKIQFPWIVRASTPIDNLPGNENAFSTEDCDYEDEAEDAIENVKVDGLRPDHPFNETTVIIAELSESNLSGTLVAHPHIANKLLVGITKGRWPWTTNGFYNIEQGISSFWDGFSKLFDEDDAPDSMQNDLAKLNQWYKEIIALPGITSAMTYQLEFGLEPLLLFQLRDFMPVQQADFETVSTSRFRNNPDDNPLVLGITPPEGIEVIVYNKEDEDRKNGHKGIGRPPEDWDPGDEFPNKEAICLVTSPTFTKFIHFPTKANIFSYAGGLLQHADIQKMRTSEVTVANYFYDYPSGSKLRIISDGIRVNITEIE